jgi:hypothetical protein
MSRAAILLVVAMAAAWLPSSTADARTCATLELLRAQREGLGSVKTIVQQRPWDDEIFVLDSEAFPVRVHYDDEVFGEIAADVLDLLEDAWQRQVVEQGFPAPLPDDGRGGDDRLDVYLTGLGAAEGATLVDDDPDPNDGKQAGPVHLRIDPSSPILTSLVHHEFQHALHFALDGQETLMFFESSAVLQEVYALGADDDAWQENLPFFQDYPQAPPFADGIDWGQAIGMITLYEYGAVLVPLYIDEVYGNGDGVLIRQIWEASVQPDGSEDNEPDWMDALQAQTGVAFRDMIPDFATWRVLVGPLAAPDDGPSVGDLMDGNALAAVRTLTLDGQRGLPIGGTEDFGAPHQLGCVLVQVRAENGQDEEIEVAADSLADPPRTLSLSWVIRDPATSATVREVGGRGPSVVERVDVPEGRSLIAAVCDLSDPDADDIPEPGAVDIRVWNTRLPFGPDVADGGPIGPDPEPEVTDGGPDMPPFTCGCQQTAEGPTGGPFDEAKKVLFPLMLLVGGASMVIRFRRSARRRKSFKGSGFKQGIAKPGATEG